MTLSGLWTYLVENFINWIIFAYAAVNLVMGIKKGEVGSMIFKLFIAGFAWLLMYLFLHFLPFGLRTVASGSVGIFFGRYLSELEIDDRGAVFFLKDYLLFYLRFGMRDNIYINKGQVYQKPKERSKH